MNKFSSPEYAAWLWRIPLIVLMIIEFASLNDYIGPDPTFTALGLLIQSFVFYCFFEVINYFIKKYGKTPPWWVASSMVGLLGIDAIGDYLYWYDTFIYFDAILHFLVPMAGTLGIWAIRHAFQLPTNYKTILFSIVPCIMTLATMYEIEEYLEDVITGSHRLGDGFDTANDLLMALVGTLFPVTLYYSYQGMQRLRLHLRK